MARKKVTPYATSKRQRDDSDDDATTNLVMKKTKIGYPATEAAQALNRVDPSPTSDASASSDSVKKMAAAAIAPAAKSSDAALVKKIGDGDIIYWELPNSSNKRALIQKWNGKTQVCIRQFYDSNGKMAPGKLGINMPVDQYKTFLKAIPLINAELRALGEEIDDAVLHAGSGASAGEGSAKKVEKVKKVKKIKKLKKANIEATSDSEEASEDSEEELAPKKLNW